MQPRDRRAWTRQANQLRVRIADPADALDQPYTGWVVDRCAGGVRLVFNRPDIRVGDILKLQPLSTIAGMPWVEVRVKYRRWHRQRLELGCEFVQRNDWEQLLLVS